MIDQKYNNHKLQSRKLDAGLIDMEYFCVHLPALKLYS